MTTTTATVIRQTRSQFLVPSRSQPGSVHVVQQRAGELICDCNAELFRKPCRHKAAVAKVIAAENDGRREFSPEFIRPGLDLLMGRSPKPAA